MFQGTSSLSLDAKGRLSIPTRHRDALLQGGTTLTITRHPHGCLMIFPQDAWADFSARIAQVKMSEQVLKRIFLGNAMDVEMDATARVLVSPELRAAAHITKEVLLMGMGSHLELWDKATYEKQEAEALQNLPADAMDNLLF